jgi:gas vesicle protein
MSDNNSGEGVLAFLLGGVMGAVLGLLLAPRSGEETRELLGDWLEENRDRTRRFLDDEREVLETQKHKIEAAWRAGKKAFEGDGDAA